MDWGKLLSLALGWVEKNPTLVEDLFTAIVKLLTNNPPLLNQAVQAGVNKLESSTKV